MYSITIYYCIHTIPIRYVRRSRDNRVTMCHYPTGYPACPMEILEGLARIPVEGVNGPAARDADKWSRYEEQVTRRGLTAARGNSTSQHSTGTRTGTSGTGTRTATSGTGTRQGTAGTGGGRSQEEEDEERKNDARRELFLKFYNS